MTAPPRAPFDYPLKTGPHVTLLCLQSKLSWLAYYWECLSRFICLFLVLCLKMDDLCLAFFFFVPMSWLSIWLAFVYFWHVTIWKTAISTPNITSVCDPFLPFLLPVDAWFTNIIHCKHKPFQNFTCFDLHFIVKLLMFISFSLFWTCDILSWVLYFKITFCVYINIC